LSPAAGGNLKLNTKNLIDLSPALTGIATDLSPSLSLKERGNALPDLKGGFSIKKK